MTITTNLSSDKRSLSICLGKVFDITAIKAFRDSYIDIRNELDEVNIDFRYIDSIDTVSATLLRNLYFHFSGQVKISLHNYSPTIKQVLKLLKLDGMVIFR